MIYIIIYISIYIYIIYIYIYILYLSIYLCVCMKLCMYVNRCIYAFILHIYMPGPHLGDRLGVYVYYILYDIYIIYISYIYISYIYEYKYIYLHARPLHLGDRLGVDARRVDERLEFGRERDRPPLAVARPVERLDANRVARGEERRPRELAVACDARRLLLARPPARLRSGRARPRRAAARAHEQTRHARVL